MLLYKDPTVVLTNPKLDNEKPITEYSFTDTITNNPDNLILNYNFHDGEYLETKRYGNEFVYYDYDFYSGCFLDSGYFQIDNQDKNDFDFSRERDQSTRIYPICNQSGEIPLDKSEGNHQVIVSVTDYGAGNTALDTIKYVIDKTPPTTSDNAPAGWQNSDFNVTLTPSDALSGVVSTKYCIDSTNDCTPDIEYTSPVSISEEGERYFRYFSTDKAGNNQPIVSEEVKLDKAAPEINIIYPEADADYIKSVDSMVVSISDLNLNKDSCWYSTDNGQTKTYFSCESGEQKTIYPDFVDGANTGTIGASDYATNTSGAEVNFYISPDAVEENKEEPALLEDYFKFYPNPVTDVGNFEFSLDKPQNLRFSMYDITGRQLEQRVLEGNLGDNKISYDFSKYDSQICIYRIIGDKGNIKTGKVFKK